MPREASRPASAVLGMRVVFVAKRKGTPARRSAAIADAAPSIAALLIHGAVEIDEAALDAVGRGKHGRFSHAGAQHSPRRAEHSRRRPNHSEHGPPIGVFSLGHAADRYGFRKEVLDLLLS